MILFIDGNKFKFDDSDYKGIKSKDELIFDLIKLKEEDCAFFKNWFLTSISNYPSKYKKNIKCLRGNETRVLVGCLPIEFYCDCFRMRYDTYTNATYEDNEENYLTETELKLISFEEYKNKILLK